jgi:hypothetical protein
VVDEVVHILIQVTQVDLEEEAAEMVVVQPQETHLL